MSTIKVTNIQATSEIASRAVSGVAAAWCNWDDNTSINDSENVSSITDDGVGITVVTYSNAMANGNYANAGVARKQSGGSFAIMRLSTTHTVSATRWVCQIEDATNVDGQMQTVSTHGDLA